MGCVGWLHLGGRSLTGEGRQQVEAGAGLVVLEAMKMGNQIKAPAPGVVEAVRVEPGQAVEKGQILVILAPPASPAGDGVA